MNRAIVILLIVGAASGGYWVGKNHNIPYDIAPSAALIEPENLTLPAVTRQPDANLEKHVPLGDALIDNTQPLHSPEKSVALDQSAQHQIDAIKADYEFRQRSESFTHWLIKNQETKSWFDLGNEMRERFDAEEIDHIWANNEEGHLQSIFMQKQELAGIAVKSTTCRSTKCQITISVADHDHANETSMAIIEALSAEKFSHIIIDSQVQQGETIFYVSSNEKGFEFN